MICEHLTADCHQIYQAQAKIEGQLVSTVTVKGCSKEKLFKLLNNNTTNFNGVFAF